MLYYQRRRGKQGIFAELNLSFTRGDEEAAVRENYRRVAKRMVTEVSHFVCSDQTHTTNVRVVTKEDAGAGVVRERGYTDVDGLITNEPGLVLSTFYADCVPLYFVDTEHHAIGLSHSGWRGTVGRMGAATIQAMQKHYGTDPKHLIVRSDRPFVRIVMRSVRMWQRHLQKNFRIMKKKF